MLFGDGLSRRRLIQSASAAGVLGATHAVEAAPKPVTIGFIYVGPRDDYGYNQAHAEGAAAIRSMPGIKVVEEERVAETDDVEKTMQSMIQLDGASLLFPTSFGYFDPYMLRIAKKYPAVQLRHCGGLWDKTKHPMNAGSYFGYIGMGQYLNGIVAGHMTKTKKIAFVAAKPIPQVLINVNSFAMGARAVDPSITTSVIFTGDWSMPVKEAEATNALIDQGADVITCHVDGPKVVVQTTEGRGAYTCGYHANQVKLAPKGYLTGAEWNWAEVYKMYASKMQAGTTLPNFTRGGLSDGFIKMSAYGPAVTPAARAQCDAAKAEIMKGNFAVFKGPLMDNKGKVVVPAGAAYAETAIELESTNWLVEGVKGSIA
jgi:simple sugar transport system substrate-binding protein